MKASERTLQQLLHSSDQYVIPVFQRYYTWGATNWDQLMEDVGELLEAGAEDRLQFAAARTDMMTESVCNCGNT